MECNKDEAIRAKDIAVRKFTDKDYTGARKFALKAQTLYPALEGISQMLATFDVYVSAQSKVEGEMDMYAILGVNPVADDETIKKQYRKLVLMLHPDKNKSVGADGAFQMVSEAMSVLSDKAKRAAYNTKRHIKMAQRVPSQSGVSFGSANLRQNSTKSGVSVPQTSAGRAADRKVPAQGGVSASSRAAEQTVRNPPQQKVPSQSGVAATPPVINGHTKHSGSKSSRGKQKKTGTQKPSKPSMWDKKDTFWTICIRCRMKYEYMRIYRNQQLKCQNCKSSFFAGEIAPPSNVAPLRPGFQQQQSFSSSGPHASGLNDPLSGASARWSPLFGTTAYYTTASSSAANAQSTSRSPPVNQGHKREREEAPVTGGSKKNNSFGFFPSGEVKRMREMGGMSFGTFGSGISSQFETVSIQSGMGNSFGSNKVFAGVGTANIFAGFGVKSRAVRDLSTAELKKMQAGRARNRVQQTLRVRNLTRMEKAAAEGREKFNAKERQKAKLAKFMLEAGSTSDSSDNQIRSELKKNPLAASAGAVEQRAPEFSVPDPDFHVFDLDRSESCFGDNQVWAGYDNDDGMPRFYALIHQVISLEPFKLKISWLNSKSSEFGSLGWVSHGFRKTCGDFKIGKLETTNLLNSFSHKVKWVKGPRGVIQIYPQEGEIWALYRNWSVDWNPSTPDEVIHAYDMVEVVQGYTNEQGVSVAPLVKVAGYRTVFRRESDPELVRHIPKEEMFRFSHQVPSHILTGEEKPNAPKGCVELDPGATPAELLQVSEATNEEQVTGAAQSTDHQ